MLACYGTNGLTTEHQQAIKELPNLQEIIIFFDGDAAGRTGIKNLQLKIKNIREGLIISHVETPDGEDINSLAQGHEPEIFTHLIDNRTDARSCVSKPDKSFLSTENDLIENQEEPVLNEVEIPVLSEVEIKNPWKSAKSAPATLHSSLFTFNSTNPDYITFTTNELQITILGGINMQQLDRLRVTLKISLNPRQSVQSASSAFQSAIRHTLDLYHSDYVEKFIRRATDELEIGSSLIKYAISTLTDKIEEYRLSQIESRKTKKPQPRKLTPERQKQAIKYLKQKDLLKRTNEDIGRTGMIGEETNRLLMYLVFTSRLREQPLHIISLGASGTGKTYLQEKISQLIPETEKLEITILSENAFYYFDRKELKNKLVLIEDMDGAQEVLYPLRELQTKRKISKTIPIKDNKGNLKTITLHVEGPISLAGTTTRERLYEDNANRSLLIYLDNTAEHREQIMEYQRKLSAGKINTAQEEQVKELFLDIQTVLKPIAVRNPFAEQLKIPESVFKPLRTNVHYLAMIETVTFYHQYQRPLQGGNHGDAAGTGEPTCSSLSSPSPPYIETQLEDIEWTNKLIKDVLLAKSDELSKQVRDFFENLKRWLRKENKPSFFSKEIQERLRIYPMKVNRYIRELESRSFIKRAGGNRKKGFEYEIHRWDDYEKLQQGADILDQILETLRQRTDAP